MKTSTRKTLWAVGVVLLVAAVAAPKVLPLTHPQKSAEGGGGTGGGKSKNADKSGGGGRGNGGGGGPPLMVSTMEVRPAPFVETIMSAGTLIAEEAVELQAETDGKVVRIGFTEGSQVRKGDLLVKLNDGELRATRDRARHRLALAEARETRLKPLADNGLVTREEYDTILAEVQVQKAEIALAAAQIEKTEIRAPFDGVVGLRYVSEGAYVNAATRVATLQRLDKLKIDFSVPEKYAARIRVGSPVTFSVSGGDRPHEGQIYALDPRVEASTRTVLIRAVCPNAERRLLPGTFASVELVLDQIDDALLVPAVAVIPGLNEKNVFVMTDGKAERRAVETGTRTASAVHILAGLKAGELVIISGLQQLRPGQAVAQMASGAGGDAPARKKPIGAGALGKGASATGAP